MRNIVKIILHCSATEAGEPIHSGHIRKWHLSRGFKDIGYHFVILLDGTIEFGRPLEKVGAHCKGYNIESVGICYIGGLKNGEPADTMTFKQEMAFVNLVRWLRSKFPLTIHGHNDFTDKKACPSFKVARKFPYL